MYVRPLEGRSRFRATPLCSGNRVSFRNFLANVSPTVRVPRARERRIPSISIHLYVHI